MAIPLQLLQLSMICKFKNHLLIISALFLWLNCNTVTGSILETEATVSLQLQKRMQDALDKIFGGNKVSILVNVKLGLSKEVKDNIKKSFRPPENLNRGQSPETAATAETNNQRKLSRVLWWDKDFDAGIYILPGFMAENKDKIKSEPERQIVYEQKYFQPDSDLILYAGVEIEKIIIKVILDKRLPLDAENTVSSVISNFIQTDPARADSIVFERITKPSPWTEMLGNTEAVYATVQKAALLAVAMIVASLITWPWFNLANTLRRFSENVIKNMALIVQERVKSNTAPENSGKSVLLPVQEEKMPQPAAYAAETHLMFNVKLERVAHLYHLLNRENPDNIGMVLPHLEPDVRKAFMALLPEDLTVKVANSLIQVRYVDPDVILKLKQELEYHLQGVIGGVEQTVELLKTMPTPARERFLVDLIMKEPDMAKAVRRKTFFFKDLLILKDTDLRLLLATLNLDELVMALADADAEITRKIINSLPDKLQTTLRQMMVFQAKPSKKDTTVAQERILTVLKNFVEEGKIGDDFLSEIEKNLV